MTLYHYRIFLWKIYCFTGKLLLQGDVVTSCGWWFNLFKMGSSKHLALSFFSPLDICGIVTISFSTKKVPHKNLCPGCIEKIFLKATENSPVCVSCFSSRILFLSQL